MKKLKQNIIKEIRQLIAIWKYRKNGYEELISHRHRKRLKPIRKIEMILIFCFISLASSSQAHFDIGGGFGNLRSDKSGHENTQGIGIITPIMRLAGGYQFGNIATEAIIQPALTNKVNSPHFFGATIGYNINGFIPAIGYMYNYSNSDDHSQNSGSVGYSLKYSFSVNDNGGLFFDALYSQKYFQLTVGFHVVFGNN